MKDIVEMAKRLPEVYQDIRVGNDVLVKGKRTCVDRWDGIRKCIGPHAVVLDVGAGTGYFSCAIAREYPDSLVVAFESDKDMCEIHAEVLRREGLYNVVVCNHRLTADELDRLSKCVTCFDVVLLLSVLHHFPPDNVVTVLDTFRKLAPWVLVELPRLDEPACGVEATSWVYDTVNGHPIVCESASHLRGVRQTYALYADGDEMGFARILRQGVLAYMGVPHENARTFDVEWREQAPGWSLKPCDGPARRMVPGVNVWDILQFNVVWPPVGWWITQSRKAYEGLEFKSDVRLWNLIVTSSGLRAIDYMTVFPTGDQAGFGHADLAELVATIAGRMMQ